MKLDASKIALRAGELFHEKGGIGAVPFILVASIVSAMCEALEKAEEEQNGK